MQLLKHFFIFYMWFLKHLNFGYIIFLILGVVSIIIL